MEVPAAPTVRLWNAPSLVGKKILQGAIELTRATQDQGAMLGLVPIAPALVLACQPQDELADLAADPGATRASARVGPAASHELAMPAKRRLWRYEERRPTRPRQ